MKVKILLAAFVFCLSATHMNAQLPYLVKDINPGKQASEPRWFTTINNTIYFSSDDGINGRQLWKSDGSQSGTKLVKLISPSSGINTFIEVNGVLFFKQYTTEVKSRLWKSDGTESGTIVMKDFGSSDIGTLTNINGTLFFLVKNADNTNELWKSDGTENGTLKIQNFGSNYIGQPYYMNGRIFFFLSGSELWSSNSNGTEAVKIKDCRLNVPGSYVESNISNFVTINKNVLFSVSYFIRQSDGTIQRTAYLWRSDGTSTGTELIRKFSDFPRSSGSLGAEVPNFMIVNGSLYFGAKDSNNNGYELWKSDGTESGTVMVKNITEYNSPFPTYLTNGNGTLFFVVTDKANSASLWKSDGTESGTVIVKNFYPNYPSYNLISGLTSVNNTVFCNIFRNNASELWKSDGTEAGTVRIDTGGLSVSTGGFKNTDGIVFFTAGEEINGYELWALKDNYNPPAIKDNSIIKISPNPFDGSATITINADISDGAELVLYDMLGKEVQRFTVTTPSFKIEREELSDGVYTLQWLNSNNTISQRLVIMR